MKRDIGETMQAIAGVLLAVVLVGYIYFGLFA